jgi:hypothetical protein
MSALFDVIYNTKMRLNEDANRYRMAHETLQELRRHLGELTVQQYRTLKCQALEGDIDGTKRALYKILNGGKL